MLRLNFRHSALIAILLLLLGLASVWTLSFFYYPLLAREADSDTGTELMAVRGNAIFYRYNSYTRVPPPQHWGVKLIPAESRMGRRISAEFDMSRARSWVTRRGFAAISWPLFGLGTTCTILSLPIWFICLIPATVLGTILYCTRRSPGGAEGRRAPTSTPTQLL